MERRARTKAIGRTLRLLLGVGFLIYVIPPTGAPALSILLSVATAVALLILYLLIHWVLTHHVRTLSSCLGVLVAACPAALIFFLGLPGGPIFGLGGGSGSGASLHRCISHRHGRARRSRLRSHDIAQRDPWEGS